MGDVSLKAGTVTDSPAIESSWDADYDIMPTCPCHYGSAGGLDVQMADAADFKCSLYTTLSITLLQLVGVLLPSLNRSWFVYVNTYFVLELKHIGKEDLG